MKLIVLYCGGWTLVCLVAFWFGPNGWWELAAGFWFFIWLVGLPVAMAQAVQRTVDSLPPDSDTTRSRDIGPDDA
jgi:hypothetical protein